MKIVEVSEVEKQNEELDALDHKMIAELAFEIHDAHKSGYQYIDLNTLERALPALAALLGATHVSSAEAALEYLSDQAVENRGIIKDLTEENEAQSKRIETLEDRPEGPKIEGLLVTDDQLDVATDVLRKAGELIAKVPRQQALANLAIRTAKILNDIEPSMIVVLSEEEVEYEESKAKK